MEKCAYCGRENEGNALACSECGTDLAGEAQPHQAAQAPSEPQAPLNLQDVEGGFTVHDGFSRPCWRFILRPLRQCPTAEEREIRENEFVTQWASRWGCELGHDYWMSASGSFFLVSELDGEKAERLLQKANWLAEKIRSFLGPLAWDDRPHILIVHVIDEALARRFDEAVSPAEEDTAAFRMAARLAPAWILICSENEGVMLEDVESALIGTSLGHLPLPRWLNLGIGGQLRRVIETARTGRSRDIVDLELVPEHRRFWNQTTIQSFWAGTGETEYPTQSRLFYELSNILVQLLVDKASTLVDYLRCAQQEDAGESAARVCFKAGLNDLAGTFLGPGSWTPDPLAIAECWDRVRGISSDEE